MTRVILCLVLVMLAITLKAQNGNQNAGEKTYRRCVTDLYLQRLLEKDPGYQARMEAAEARIATGMQAKLLARRRAGNLRTNASVVIPTVVHIILSDPNLVTNADVQWQIDKLNTDFAGLNADSVNAGPFAALFGHSRIQFCLAQQDPQGNATNGINRVTSSITFNQNNYDNLKRASNCGTDAWDPAKYFNIWVAVSADGTLGVATFPEGGDPLEQGIVLALESFGNNPAYVAASYNLGRTAVHETGHFFFARHIWGDGGGCQPDFPVVAGISGSWTDDTPTQSGATIGCPTGIQPAGCGSPNPPGKMYQNYMDYTNDACYCLFTINQVLRMETVLDTFRASLMTSDKCTPAIVHANDASVSAIITPSSGSACIAATNSFCGPDFNAEITLKNYGSATLATAIIYAQVDNLAPVSMNWSGSLATGALVNVTLPTITASAGSHTLKIYVSSPNGAADGRTTNDTLSTTFSIQMPLTAPVTEGFESALFPPAGWQLINPNPSSISWERTIAAAKTGVASARIRFFDYSSGTDHVDYLVSPPISVQANDSVTVSFDRAYRLFSTSSSFADTLAVIMSFDCGKTFTEVWKRSGADLASVPGTTSSAFIPGASDWLSAQVDLRPYITSSGNLIVGFKAVNRYGNNLYLDNIIIERYVTQAVDARITGIITPSTHECSRNLMPVISVRNEGSDTLKSMTIVLQVDNTMVGSVEWTGSLLPAGTTNITGPNLVIPAGSNHSFTAYSILPNGVADGNPVNDTARTSFIMHDVQALPVTEGFENSSFPPANWSVTSSGSTYTWERTTRTAKTGIASTWIRNFSFTSNGKPDDLYSPLLQANQFDSLVVDFDMAHAMVNPSTNAPDTLQVLLTKDCGKTFQVVYKKWGQDLKTTGSQTPTFPPGDTTGYVPNSTTAWRNEYIILSELVSPGEKFMVVFRNTSSRGNNLFLDNINIRSVTLPAALKINGYLIAPNPFSGTFFIRHVAMPTDLRAVVIANAAGQIVYRRQFNGNASNYMEIDLTRYTSGMYHVKLIYSNRVVDQKLIKIAN